MGIQTQEADLKLLQLNEVVGVSFISGETALCSGITAKSVSFSDKSDHSSSSKRNGL